MDRDLIGYGQNRPDVSCSIDAAVEIAVKVDIKIADFSNARLFRFRFTP